MESLFWGVGQNPYPPGCEARPAAHETGRAMRQIRSLARADLSVVPVVNFLTGLILGISVALLDLAFQLVAATVDRNRVVVRELAPTAP